MIYDKLYSWQQDIIDKYQHRNSLGIFLDMGLGKTPISLAFAEKNLCTKIIIITINSKAIEDETEDGSWLNWGRQLNINYNFHTKNSKSFKQNANDLFLVNYESLFKRTSDKKHRVELKDNILSFVESCKGHNVAIIVDESHKLKNLQSQQTLAIFEIQKRLLRFSSVYTYLLTGTPFTVGYIDLYSQLKMLGYDKIKTHFVDTYCIKGNIPGLLGWQQPIVGYKNLDNLYALIHQYAITIKSDDIINLPKQVFTNIKLPLSNEFVLFTNEKLSGIKLDDEYKRRNLNLITNEVKQLNNPFFRNIDYPNLKWIADTNGTFWLRCRQLSIGFQGNSEDAKWYDKERLNQAKKFLSNNIDNYIIFYNFTPELYELYSICEELGYNIDVYCGEIKSLYFYDKYRELNDSEKLVNKNNVVLANYASGSTGVNWQLYNKCILFSVPLYKDYEQGLKRIHRIGQKETTFYYIFYQENWLDKNMLKALKEKTNYSLKMFENDINLEKTSLLN